MPTAPTVVQNQRDTAVLGTETRRSRDVTPALSLLEPDAGPLTTILTKLRKRGAVDPKIEWFEDQLLPRFDILGAAVTDTVGTTITVTNYKYFRKGDLVRVNKAEIMRVTTTPSSTSVAVKRGVGETAAATAANGSQLHILSNSNQEGAAVRSILSTQRAPVYNYLQIIRDPWGVTNTAKLTATFAGMDWTEEAQKQLIEHKKHIEYAYILGQRYEDTSGTNPERTTRGIRAFLSSNVKAINGALTESLLDDFLRTAFRYGAKTKLFFAAPIVMQAINGFAKPKLRLVPSDKSYGITLTQYENAGRVILLHEHVLMTNSDLNDFTGIGGEGILVDPEDVVARYLNGRFTLHNENIQSPDADARIDEYLSETGLELRQEAKHGLMTGVNS